MNLVDKGRREAFLRTKTATLDDPPYCKEFCRLMFCLLAVLIYLCLVCTSLYVCMFSTAHLEIRNVPFPKKVSSDSDLP
jgi:hypothetical protein